MARSARATASRPGSARCCSRRSFSSRRSRCGYVTVGQSKAAGVDVRKLKADQYAARKAATEAFEEAAGHAWFLMTNNGTCTRGATPATPADPVSSNKQNGLENDVNVLQSDGEGKATPVRIGELKGGGLERSGPSTAACWPARRTRRRTRAISISSARAPKRKTACLIR